MNNRGIVKHHFLLILAQVFALGGFALGLFFLLRTNGGTLFLFSAVAPGLFTFAGLLVLGVGIYAFRRQHSLFGHEIFQRGQFVFMQGEPGDCAYFIQSGSVEIMRSRDGGPPAVIAKLGKGQFFGEAALLSEGPRNATVRAVETSKLAILGKENFLNLCKMLPAARQDIMKVVQERVEKEST
jgi:hypothetical protein